ncbi:MAG: group I truncated hemoglobin [Woeseiaceae bacterium]
MEATLYEQIGGAGGINRLVDVFYSRVLADRELKRFFKGVEMAKLRRMQVELFSAALGGPLAYSGRSMVQAHRHLQIGLQDYQRFIRHLFDTLDDAGFGLSEQERYEVVGRLNILTNDVMSGGTGLVG